MEHTSPSPRRGSVRERAGCRGDSFRIWRSRPWLDRAGLAAGRIGWRASGPRDRPRSLSTTSKRVAARRRLPWDGPGTAGFAPGSCDRPTPPAVPRLLRGRARAPSEVRRRRQGSLPARTGPCPGGAIRRPPSRESSPAARRARRSHRSVACGPCRLASDSSISG